MKRSEIEQKLNDAMYEAFKHGRKFMGKDIIDLVEAAGMLPPPIDDGEYVPKMFEWESE
jgi:hypothetical protein